MKILASLGNQIGASHCCMATLFSLSTDSCRRPHLPIIQLRLHAPALRTCKFIEALQPMH